MAIKTTTEQLEEVQAAITAVMAGQSYKLDGTISVTKANLAELTKREEMLLSRYRRENRSGGVLTRPNWSGSAVDEVAD